MTDSGDGNEESRPESVSSDFNNISEVSVGLTSDTKNNVLLRKCRLCRRLARAFFCADCVKNGNFTHSKERYPERFADKKLKLYGLTEERADNLKEVERVVQECFCKTRMRQNIIQYKDRVQTLQFAVEEKMSQITNKKEEIRNVSDDIYNLKQKGQSKSEKLQKLHRYVDSTNEKVQTKQKELEEKMLSLNQVRKENINLLVTYIFPLTQIESSSR